MGLVDFSKFQPKPLKRLDLSAYANPERKRVDFASFVPKETLDLLEQEKEWEKDLARRNDPTLYIPMGGAPGGPLGGNIKEYDGLQDDVIKFYEQEGRADPEELVRVIAGDKSQLLREELQRRGDFKLDRLNPVSEVPDFYDSKGKAVPMHRRTVTAQALSAERYKELEPEIKRYEQETWERDDYGPSQAETRNIAKRIESTGDEVEKQRLRDLRGELKKRGTYIEEDRLEINEDPKRDKAITEAARPIVNEFKNLISSSDSSMGMVSSYDITRGFDNQIAAEQDLTKKRAMLEARRQLKDAKYIDDDESSGLKATLSSLGAGSVMAAKGINELARWGMKGLYALANDTTGLPPEIRDAIDLERIGRANDEEATMQALDEVSQFLGERMADIDSVREDAAPGITDRRNKIMAAGGFIDAIKKSIDDPMATLSIVGDSVPLMAAGAGLGRAIAGMAGTSTTSGLIGSQVAGESILAGSVNAASVREQLMQPDVQEQIKTFPEWKIALDAAGGDEKKAMRNIVDMAAGNTGVSSAALTAFFGRMFSGVNAQLAGAEVRRGLLPYARTVAGETVQEMGQEGGDKFSENIGVNQAGFQRDPTEGVGSAMGMGAVMGGAMASGIGAPQLLGGRAEEDARILSMYADRKRVEQNLATPERVQPARAPEPVENTITPQMVAELKALGASDVQIHLLSPQKAREIIQARGSAEAKRDLLLERPRDVARAPSTGDPDLDAGNALAEDIIASVRGQETDLERQDREEKDRLRELLPVTPITSIDEQQQAEQVMDGAPQIGSLDDQAQAATELDAAIAERQATDQSTIEPVDQGLADERALPDVAGSALPVDAGRTDGMAGSGQPSVDQTVLSGEQRAESALSQDDPDYRITPEQARQKIIEQTMDVDEVAKNGDSSLSPWLMSDGSIVGSNGDHIAFAADNAKSEIKGYSDFTRETGAIRASMFRRNNGAFVIALHGAGGLNDKQINTVKKLASKNDNVEIYYGEVDGIENPEYSLVSIDNIPKNQGVTDDLRTPDDGAVEAPQTVDENLLKMADLLSQEGSTDPLPPGGFSEAASELIPSVESEIGWTERGGNLVRDPQTGAVTGRTTWVAKPSILGGLSEFWKGRPEPISEKAAALAIEKFRKGERLAPIERRFVTYAGKYAEQVLEETQAYNETRRAEDREPKTFTAPDGTEIRYSKPANQSKIDDVREGWSNLGIDGSVSESAKQISVGKIVVQKDSRSEGVGTKAMRQLMDYADSIGKPIVLSPSTDFGGSSTSRLKKFYSSLGFVENTGKNKDFSISETMYRNPKEVRYSKSPARGEFQIAEGNDDLSALARLASRPEAFQTPSSKTKNLSDLVGELMPKASIAGVDSVETESGRTARELTINLPRNNEGRVAKAKIIDDGESVWIDVSDATQGQGAGKVYNIAAQYAANNGRKFIQDPSGLSDDGAYRRVSQLLSQALKQGTTANIDPGERLTNKDRLPVRRIRWSQDDTSNLRELTDAEVQNTFMQVPEVAGFAYDFSGKQFINDDGGAVSDEEFDRIAKAYRASGRGPVRRKGNSDTSFAPIGGTTLKRAVLLDTISRESGGERWDAILDSISAQQSAGLDPQLEELFYSKGGSSDTKPKGDARKAAEKAWGKRLIDKLVRNRILTFVSRADVRQMNKGKTDPRTIIDDRANAFVVDGRAYIINENVSDDAAPGITLHEVGVHYGLEAMVGPEVFKKILADLKSLQKTDERVKAAYARVPKDTATKYIDEEALGYLVEMDPQHGLIQRIVDAIVTFLKRIGFQNEGLLQESRADEIMRIVRNSLRNAGKPQNAGVVVYSDYDNAYSQPEIGDNFYSAMARSVEQAKGAPKTGTPKQWKEWLDGAQRRGEFKQSERDWIGVDAWLDGREQTTRKDLADFVRANEVQVSDVVLGGRDAVIAFDDEMQSKYGNGWVLEMSDTEGSQRQKLLNETDVKFDKYRTPGDGKNYRELLLTLPEKDTLTTKSVQAPNGWGTTDGGNIGIERTGDTGADYRSSHWDQPNVLAHVRFDERTDAEGRKVLFIQEIQSDMHQDGRKHGYKSSVTKAEDLRAARAEAILVIRRNDLYGFDTATEALISIRSEPDFQKAWDIEPEDAYVLRNYQRLWRGGEKNRNGVPDAPLKGTDEWATLAFKRMARWGAENNFDRIAWATGEQNADVFDLSKRVSRIEYDKNPSDNTFNVMVHGLDGQGLLWSSRRATSDQVADAVGKEVAEKMDAGEGNRVGGIGSDMMSLSGEGLKVGGKGMRGFYDKILPAAVNKWAKPFGARTEMAEVSGTMQPTITITPKMREAALKGLPLFSKPDPNFSQSADYTFKESDYRSSVVSWAKENLDFTAPNGKPAWQNFVRWFGDSAVVNKDGKPMVVYHETSGDFYAFSEKKRSDGFGFYFATSQKLAKKASQSKGRSIAAYVSAQNVAGSQKNPVGTWLDLRYGGLGVKLAEQGFDGAWVRDEGKVSLIVRNPEQIKSAAENTGSFDSATPDIRYSMPPRPRLTELEAREEAAKQAKEEAALKRRAKEERSKQARDDMRKAESELRTKASALESALGREVSIADKIKALNNLINEGSLTDQEIPGLKEQIKDLRDAARRAKESAVAGDRDAVDDYSDLREQETKTRRDLAAARAKAKAAMDAVDASIKAADAAQAAASRTTIAGQQAQTAAQKAATAAQNLTQANNALAAAIAALNQTAAAAKATRKAASKARAWVRAKKRAIIMARKKAADKRATLATGLGASPSAQPSFVATDWFQSGMMGSLRNLKEALQDKLAPVLYIQRDIRAAGRIIEEAADVHARENLMHGRAGNILEMDERNYIAPQKSYMRSNKLGYDMLDDYLEARHAGERNDDAAKKNQSMPDGGSGMTTEQANDFLNGVDAGLRSGKKLTPDLKRKMDRAAGYLDRLLAESRDRMLSNGLITQAEYDALKKYKHYVPLKNELDGREMGFGGGRGSGIDARPAALRNALGRGAGNRAGDILSHALGDTQRLVVLGEKARVGRTLARLVLDNPNKDVWEIEPVILEQKLNTAGEVYMGLQNLQNDPLVMVIKFEGRPYKIKFGDNPVGRRLAASLKNLNNLDAKAYTTIFGGINRFYSKMMTSYSPAFMIVNMMRDLFYGTTGIGAEKGSKAFRLAVKYYMPSMRAIFKDQRGSTTPNTLVAKYLKEYSEAGGKTAFNEGKQAEDYQKDTERFMKGYFKLLAEGSPIEMMTKFVEENSVMKLIHDTNDSIENALRLSAFIALREIGETVEKSATYAKNMTVNFNRKGSASTFMNATYLFFNAAVQGSHRTIMLLKNRKVQATMATLFAMQAGFAFLLAGMEDDDGVTIADKIHDNVWQKNLVIPWMGSEAGYFTIPMPYGFNVFSYSGGRIAKEAAGMMKGDGFKPMSVAGDITAAVMGSFSPINASMGMHTFIPTLPGQLVGQSWANETSFGAPIRDEWLNDKQARAYQGKPSTPMFYHAVAQALNAVGGGTTKEKPALGVILDQAPEDIKFMVENIGGGPLRFLSQIFGYGESLAYGAETGPGDIPLVSAIIPKLDKGSATQRVYYDKTLPAIVNDEEIIKESAARGEDWQNASVKPEMEDSFKVARKKDGTRAKPPKGSLGPKLEPVRGSLPDIKSKVEKEVKRLRDEMRAIRNDPDMSQAKKKLAIDELNKEIASVMAELITEQRTQRREARNRQ